MSKDVQPVQQMPVHRVSSGVDCRLKVLYIQYNIPYIYNLKNSLNFKLLAFWRKETEKVTKKIWQGPPLADFSAVFFHISQFLTGICRNKSQLSRAID